MKMIDDWRKAWKFLSVQVSGIFAAAVSAWLVLPADSRHQLLSLLPFDLGGKGPAIMVLLGFIGVIIARIKSQPGLDVKRDDEPPAPPLPVDIDIEWLRNGDRPPAGYRTAAQKYPPPPSDDPVRSWPPAAPVPPAGPKDQP